MNIECKNILKLSKTIGNESLMHARESTLKHTALDD